MSKRKTKINLDKYFLPLSLLSSLYALSFSFIFFFEGAKSLSIAMLATSALSAVCTIFSIRSKRNEVKDRLNLSYLAIYHIGFLFAATISGGLFSPMIWGQLVISPMSYKFLSKKKLGHMTSAIVFANICGLFCWQSNFQLPLNVFSGPANPVIQFLAIVPVFLFFPISTLLGSGTQSKEDKNEENVSRQFPMAS